MGNLLLLDKGSSYVRDYAKSLERKGWRLSDALNIRDAVNDLKSNSPDLIIIDSSASHDFPTSPSFKKNSLSIPKILLLNGRLPGKTKKAWLKCGHVFPVNGDLTFEELMKWVNNISFYNLLKSQDERLRADLIQKSKSSSLLDSVSRILSSDSDSGTILRSILKVLKELSGARASSLLISDEPFFEMLNLRKSTMIRKQVFEKGTGISGFVMETGIALNIKNAQTDRRYNQKADSLGKTKVGALLCVPVEIHGRVMGVIRLINSDDRRAFSADDMDLLKHGADFAAIAIERAFLYEKLKNDELTNLYNISYLRQAIDQEIERSRRFDSVFSLIFMDMDNFKKVNDRHGHLVGSRVIVEIARLLQDNVRKLDMVSRYGGDEFVIILPQTSREVSFIVAERLRRLIEKNVFLKNESYEIRLTASFGVASYPYNAKKKEELLRLADNAMYSGKFLTKNMVFEAK